MGVSGGTGEFDGEYKIGGDVMNNMRVISVCECKKQLGKETFSLLYSRGIGNGFSHFYQMTDGTCCHYIFIRKSKKEMIDYALNNGPAMQVGKFLVPAVATELKLTIQDLKKLKPLITKLDVEHLYEAEIYEAYIKNNGFFLTEEQRQKAFGLYRAARPYPIGKGRRQR